MTSPTHPSRRHALPQPRRWAAGTILAAAALSGAWLAPVWAAEPSSPAPGSVDTASILIVSLDTRGTDAIDDDVLLDGTTFAVHADDGDGIFDVTLDAAAQGSTPAVGGLLDTVRLGPARYWVAAAPPAGYAGAPPILVELNTDATKTCVWESAGLAECQANDAGAEGLSWTMVLVRSAPVATPSAAPTPAPTAAATDPTTAPTGEVQEATGRPALTLPPTDVASPGRKPPSTPAAGWVVVLLLSSSALISWVPWSRRAVAGRPPGHGLR